MAEETTEDARTAALLDGLSKILVDLEQVRKRDPETVMLIGSLADRLCIDAGQVDWPAVKAVLGDAERQSLINTLTREVADSNGKGDIKTAYAMQTIGASLAGATLSDERITKGVELLDSFINAARGFYVRNQPATH